MTHGETSTSFGQRLASLLKQLEPKRSQAWLAERTGLDRSLVSRLLRDERVPTADALQCLAPALGVDVADLVRGTDAELRLHQVTQTVRRSDYEAVVQKLAEYEGHDGELRARVRTLEEALTREEDSRTNAQHAASEAHMLREHAERDLRHARETARRLELDLRRHRDALARAATEVAALRTRFRELQAELGSTAKSARTTAILAGVAAFTGVVTVAHFLGADDAPAPIEGTPIKRTKTSRSSQ